MVEKVLAIFSSWAIILSLKECIRYIPTDLRNVHEVLLNEKNKI